MSCGGLSVPCHLGITWLLFYGDMSTPGQQLGNTYALSQKLLNRSYNG